MTIDWLLVIDQWSVHVLPITCLHPPASHTHTHTHTHTRQTFSKSYKFMQIYSNSRINANSLIYPGFRAAERRPPLWFFSYGCAPLPGSFSCLPDREKMTCVWGVTERSFSWVPRSGCFLYLWWPGKVLFVFLCAMFVFLRTRWLWKCEVKG